MNTLVIIFNANGTIRKATIRHSGKEVPDMTIDEVWQFYEILVLLGHEIRYTGLGMAYIDLQGIKLTETMDKEIIYMELAQIGMAIMKDTLRKASA